MTNSEYKLLVLCLIVLILFNLGLMAWMGNGSRCISSSACVCRDAYTLCWDQ